jgi:hypothetical protein
VAGQANYWPLVAALAWIRWRDAEVAHAIEEQGRQGYVAALMYAEFPMPLASGPRTPSTVETQDRQLLLAALRAGRIAAHQQTKASASIVDIDPRKWLGCSILASGEVLSASGTPILGLYVDATAVRREWPLVGRDLESELHAWLAEFLDRHAPAPGLTKETIRERSAPKVGIRTFNRVWSTIVRTRPQWRRTGPRRRVRNAIQDTSIKSER